MRRSLVSFLLLLACVLAPTGQAALVPSHHFEGTFEVQPLGGEQETGEGEEGGPAGPQPPPVYLMGDLAIEGQGSGLFMFVGVKATRIEIIQRVEVYELSQDPSRVDRREFAATGRPIHRAFTDAVVEIPENATFYYWAPHDSPHDFEVASPLALALPVLPPDVPVANFGTINANASLLVAGGVVADLTMLPEGDAFLVPVNQATTLTVTSQSAQPATFTGPQYLLRIMEATPSHVEAQAALVPMEPGSTAIVRPASEAVLAERFDVATFMEGLTHFTGAASQETEGEADPNATESQIVDPRVVQVFDALSPMLNGAIIGSLPNATIVVGDASEPTLLDGFTFVRASQLTLDALEDGVTLHYEGDGALLLFNKEFYSEAAVVGGPPVPVPLLTLLLWPLAIAAIVVTYLVRLPVPPTAPGVGGALRVLGLVANIALAALAFILWDVETKGFLGTSLLTLLTGGANPTGIGVGLVAGLQSLSLLLAYLLLGLPVRLMANSALRIVQLKRARGVGAGLGHLGSWGLGAPLMPLFLTPLAGLVSGLGL